MFNKSKLIRYLKKGVLIKDGAMGSFLMSKGLPDGMVPEWAILNIPDAVADIHRQYVSAGANIIFTNTFSGSRRRLSEFGLGDKVDEINKRAVEIARSSGDSNTIVAGDIGPSGEYIKPVGQQSFSEAYDNFYEQASVLSNAGVDIIVIETMSELREIKAALLAVKNVFDGVIIASMTFSEGDRTVTGTPPSVAASVLDAMGADVIGANCSFGPDKLLPIVQELANYTEKPVSVFPNAGIPRVADGKTVYDTKPDEFASYAIKFVEAGASIIGGCCGTTPRHISAIADAVTDAKPGNSKQIISTLLTSATRVIEIPRDGFVVVGERLNPSNRDRLTQQLLAGSTTIVREEVRRQVDAGADIIDVNVGIGSGAEPAAMIAAIEAVEAGCDCPISVDSADSAILEMGARRLTGKGLLNSVTGELEKLDKIIPIAKKYGAAFVGLTMDENGIPDTASGRADIAERIIDYALNHGVPIENIFIDCLMMTAANENPQITFDTIRAIKQNFGVHTILGISNVSHGLPKRPVINSSAFIYALGHGLNAAIINPYDDIMSDAISTVKLLRGEDNSVRDFTELYAENNKANNRLDDSIGGRFDRVICEGHKDQISSLIDAAMEKDEKPIEIISKYITPALKRVGDKYERKEIYLPHLILAAETVQRAFSLLESLIDCTNEEKRGTILFATVKGDVHDIGKNIVAAVMRGYGFNIIDMGKNVPTDSILSKAEDGTVDIIALSALMTTTMNEMTSIAQELSKRKLYIPIMVGGAVVSKEYADSIGAYYAQNATQAAQLAKTLIERKNV